MEEGDHKELKLVEDFTEISEEVFKRSHTDNINEISQLDAEEENNFLPERGIQKSNDDYSH